MRKHAFHLIPVGALLLVIVGCPKPASTVVNSAGDKKLSLTKPSDVSIVRNANAEITIKIARDGFRDPVAVTFSDLPKGVEPKDRDNKIAAEATSGTFTLHANADAALVTNQDVHVTVTGPDNLKQMDMFKLTVKDK